MKTRSIFTVIAFVAGLWGLSHAIAQNVESNSQVQSQGSAPALNQAAPQGEENDSTLELAPQAGAMKPKVQEIPEERRFNPDSDTSSLQPNYKPDIENGDSTESLRRPLPYVGVEVQWATECFKGGEEYGLKVTKVDPNSPAAAAGLQAGHDVTAAGAAAATLAGIIPMVSPIVGHFAEKSGSFGNDGDLIVAVDDERIRNQSDFQSKLAQLKPGSTMYLTVIRPTGDGNHKTLKLAVRVGQPNQPVARADSP
jgi:hypothetical protein